jgi:putative ABC transport system permease protein
VLRDIRFGLRLLWKDRGYAVTAILTLAVCLGANTAIFTIVNSILLKPLPVPDSNRILLMSNQYPNVGTGITTFENSGVPDYYDRLRDVHVYEEQAMYNGTNQSIEIDGVPQLVRGMAGTPSLFRLLHVPPVQGRIFDDSEGEIGSEQKVILSYPLWQQLFAGKPGAIGSEIRMSSRPYTIVGVMPKGFEFADSEARFWIPLTFTPEQKSDDARHSNSWFNVGRLKPGATIEQAQQQVNALNAANLERFPQLKQLIINAGFNTKVEELQDVLVRGVRPTLYLLWGGAAFVLLIGSVNIANLTLARSSLRMKELSTRLAIGAARGQLARQLIIESLLLALAGGIGAILAGAGILRALQSIGLERIPRADEIHMDLTVLGATLAVSLITGFLIGLVPIAHMFKVNLGTALREESRSGTGRKARAVRRVLVVAQVAFAFVLLIGSGLLLASFRNLLAVDAGFKSEGVITAGIGMPRARYAGDSDVRTFTNRLLLAIRSIPGVSNAGGTTLVPLSGNHSDSVILAEGYQMKPGESLVSPMQVIVTDGYLEAMNTRLVRGRYFNEHDNETAGTRAIIVDERLAQKFWPGADPVGKRMYNPSNPRDLLKVDEKTQWLTVVGVVREVQLEDLAGRKGSVGAYYLPAAQRVPRGLTLAVKTAGNPENVLPAIRAELKKIDPAMPLASVRTMNEYVSRSLMSRRAAMALAIAFGIVSLFLSAVGIYGVLAYLVTQRTREIGIRIALGSTTQGIFQLVIREGLWLVVTGIVIGLSGVVLLRHVLEAQIYGLAPMDPLVMIVVVGTLGAIALAACSLPAGRATRVDPVAALNQQ